MTVEFVGMIGASYYSEAAVPTGPPVDLDYLERFARAYCDGGDGGFDWTLVPYSSAAPESDQLAAWVLARTERLKVMLAHRTGVVHPVHAARAFATLDQLSGGRLGVHFLAGSDAEQEREGDYVDIGCDIVSVRGYDPLDDAVDLARYVLPLVRDELARRTRFAEVTA